jgi:hypothetical protein
MATIKQRFQNPVVGDTVRLRLHVYSSNVMSNVLSVEKVDIYYLDPVERTVANPDGRILVQTIDGALVVNEEAGKYYLDVDAVKPAYIIGSYIDVWSVVLEDESDAVSYDNTFTLYPKLWYASPVPIVYGFDFRFTPNRITKGSIKPLIIQIIPQTPTGTELQQYYANIAIYSDLQISIAKKCDPCSPCGSDLDLIVDAELIEDREKCAAYYKLDTTEMDCGLYDVWFTMEFGSNVYVSDKNQLLIH